MLAPQMGMRGPSMLVYLRFVSNSGRTRVVFLVRPRIMGEPPNLNHLVFKVRSLIEKDSHITNHLPMICFLAQRTLLTKNLPYALSFFRPLLPNDLDESPSVFDFFDCHEAPLAITTLAPSLPRIPRSCGLGLCPRPRFLFKNPSIPVGFCDVSMSLASAGNVASFFARSDQLPPSPSTTCTPPPWDSFRVPVGWCCRL